MLLTLERSRIARGSRLRPVTRAMVVALALPFGAGMARAQVPDPQLWVTDGQVSTIVSTPSTIYLGGQFASVGPAVGGCLFVDGTSASLPGFPKVAGQVFCMAPDGAGGWYIGGYFTTVGGLPRSNLAHVLADGSVGGWNPGTDTDVFAVAVSGPTVYVGG